MGEVLCVAAIVLLIVMFVGHGMWLVAAWLFRSVADDAPAAAPRVSRLRDELQTTIQHLKRLGNTGAISRQQCDELVALFEAELNHVHSAGQAFLPREAESGRRESGRQECLPHASAGAAAVAANGNLEVIDAILVEPPALSSVVPPVRPAPPVQSPVRPAAAQQPVHPLDRPYVPPPPAPPRRPGRGWADVLQSFMEESNIRWGEILAATLIVLCSVGLVISLRNTLKNIPYFPAILFTLFTVSFHGVGLYTLRRWKLQAVSRVILMISLLLVPLTFCGAIILPQARPSTDALFLVALAAGGAIFTWVCYSASRELVAGGAWPLTIGVLGPSLSQVLIQRLDLNAFDAAGLVALNAAAALPVGAFLMATGWQIGRARGWPQLSKTRVVQILRVLGAATFAVLPPLALILVHSHRPAFTVAHLGPLLSLSAAAALALGLMIHRRTSARQLAAWRTVGTAILVLAGVLLLVLVAAAWPDPELLLVLGLMNCAILAVLGIVAELPLLYVPSVACAALSVVIGWHLVGGHFVDRDQLSLKIVQALLRGQTSIALGLLGAVVGGMGARLMARKKAEDALMLLASGGGLAVLSLAIALFSGFVAVPDWPQDRDLAAAILLVYAAALVAAAPLSRRQEVVACGSLLLWLAFVQALVFNATIRGWLAEMHWLPARPVLTATLAHGVLTAIGSLASLRGTPRGRTLGHLLSEPLAIGAAISLAAATPFIAWVQHDQFSAAAALALWAALGWGALALAQSWPWALSAVQAMLALAPALLIAGVWKTRLGDANWFLNERHLFSQLIAAAVATMLWSPSRRLTSDRKAASRLLIAPWPAVDQVLLGAAAMALPLVTILLVLPDIGWELNFEPYMRSPSLAAAGELPSALQYGWIALAVVLAALAVSLCERVSVAATSGVGIATFAAVSLAAGHFQPAAAAASASRWAAAVYAVLWGALYISRDPLRAACKQITWLRWDRFPRSASIWFCAQPLLLGGRAILILTIIAVSQHANGITLKGPAADSIFTALGPTVSYAGPLIALVVVLLGYAIRERQAAFALGGAAVWQLAVNLAWLLHVSSNQPADLQSIEWLQWNSIAAGAFACIWLGLSPWITRQVAGTLRVPLIGDGTRSVPTTEQQVADGLWFIPLGVAGISAAALVGWAALAIFESPAAPAAVLMPLGSWLSYVAVGLVIAAAVGWAHGRLEFDGLGDAATWLAVGIASLVAATANRLDSGGQWLAYHHLGAGWLAIGAAACGLVCWAVRARDSRLARVTSHHLSVAVIGGLLVVLAVRGNYADPAQPWWSLGGALAACAIAAVLGLARRSQPYAFASTALAGLSVILFWNAPATAPWTGAVFGSGEAGFVAAIECLVFVLIAASACWLTREIASQLRLNQSFDARPAMPRVHAAVAVGMLPIYFVLRLGLDALPLWSIKSAGSSAASIVTTLAFAGLLAAMLWDRRAAFLVPLAYLWGGVAWLLSVGLIARWLAGALEPTLHYNLEAHIALLVLCAALQVAITGQIWSYGANLAALGERLGIMNPVGGLIRAERWLIPLNALVAAGVCIADLLLVLTLGDLPLRVAAAWGPAIVAWGVLCLAQERRRDALQLASLLLAGLSAVFLAWAQIDPREAGVWMTRTFRLLMVLAALTFAYGLLLPRLLLTSGSWNAATRKAGYLAGVAAIATFVVTLVLETTMFQPGVGNGVDSLQVAAIAVVLLALIAGLISLAVLPGRDPLVLSERGRQGYVYAAEITAALLFAHLYVCKPMWFDGLLRPYWPFIVMGLAFLGVGASELFERFKVRVLAEPLSRTGALLPLLPVLGWWAADSQVDYSLLLLVAGLLYLALSYTKKSWAAMIAAAIAGNGALWSLLSETQFSFTTNPQFWLIPPALSVLAAAQLNRARLAPELLTAIRYAATIVIYVSSTSEIFTRGFDAGVVPPMILLALALVGALVGIALRVQAFLFLGSTFMLVALITMVRHAAQSIDHTWPWWVFGITVSVSILFFLGLFEKKRPEIMLLIGRLQQWER